MGPFNKQGPPALKEVLIYRINMDPLERASAKSVYSYNTLFILVTEKYKFYAINVIVATHN